MERTVLSADAGSDLRSICDAMNMELSGVRLQCGVRRWSGWLSLSGVGPARRDVFSSRSERARQGTSAVRSSDAHMSWELRMRRSYNISARFSWFFAGLSMAESHFFRCAGT